jgi:hypothetical protein
MQVGCRKYINDQYHLNLVYKSQNGAQNIGEEMAGTLACKFLLFVF